MFKTLKHDTVAIEKCEKSNLEYEIFLNVEDLIASLKEKDVVVLSSMYSMSRKRVEIVKYMHEMLDKVIRFMALDIPMTITTDISGKAFKFLIETIESIVEYERKVHSGRPVAMEWEEFCKQYERVLYDRVRPTDLMNELGMPVGTYYRYKARYDKEHGLRK